MTSPVRATNDLELAEQRTPFLSGPPRSGELTPFAEKIAAQAFVWLASIVVFGSTANFASTIDVCESLCRFGIATGVVSFLFTSGMLLAHYLTWSNKIDKGTWFSSGAETKYMYFLLLWWTIGVACLSSLVDFKGTGIPARHTSGLAIMFGWLAFFASIYGAYKAYHSEKEEQRSLRYAQIMSLQATEEEEYANFS